MVYKVPHEHIAKKGGPEAPLYPGEKSPAYPMRVNKVFRIVLSVAMIEALA